MTIPSVAFDAGTRRPMSAGESNAGHLNTTWIVDVN